jgi:hypothetical protein
MRTTRRYLVAATVLSCLAALPGRATGQTGFQLEVELRGMLALIPDRESDPQAARVVAVNESTAVRAAGHLRHHAFLSVPCKDLLEPSDRNNCDAKVSGWQQVPSDPTTTGIDLSKGFDIRVLAGNNEVVDGLVSSPLLDRYLVDLAAIGSSVAKPAAVLSEKATQKLNDLVAFRVSLRGGDLEVGRLEMREGWSMVAPDGVIKDRRDRLAGSLLWRLPIFHESATIRLTSFDGKSNLDLKLKPQADRRLRIALTNEPTTDDFCQHEPNPNNPIVRHFAGFYRLADKPKMSEMALLRYDGHETGCGGPFVGNWPRICTMVLFESEQQEW